MKTTFPTISVLLAVAMTATVQVASAQSFNVDVGATASTNPMPVYGAGAAQPGQWNWFSSAAINIAQGLTSVAGAATPATLRVDAGNGSFAFNNAATLLDDERLMDDIFDVGPAGSVSNWTFENLAAGGYWVYTYAWAPDNAAFRTKVHVPGSFDPDQTIGGAWVAAIGQQYVRTFSVHFLVLAAGADLTVTTISDGTSGSVNGFQLVYGGFGLCDGELQRYCTAKVNSAGCAPAISSVGVPSGSAGAGFHVLASSILPNKPGLLLYSTAGPAAASLGGGTLCLASPVRRAWSVFSGGAGACGGSFNMDVNAFIAANPVLQPAGTSVWVQYWSRDPGFATPNNMSLTDALRFTVCF